MQRECKFSGNVSNRSDNILSRMMFYYFFVRGCCVSNFNRSESFGVGRTFYRSSFFLFVGFSGVLELKTWQNVEYDVRWAFQ